MAWERLRSHRVRPQALAYDLAQTVRLTPRLGADADPPCLALALSHRLAAALPLGAVRARCWPLRALPPAGARVACLADGLWFDEGLRAWHDGPGRRARLPGSDELRRVRLTRVALSAAHLDHDPINNAPGNLRSLCQRCHLQHDRTHHLAQRRLSYRLRWALGDLFEGRYRFSSNSSGPSLRTLPIARETRQNRNVAAEGRSSAGGSPLRGVRSPSTSPTQPDRPVRRLQHCGHPVMPRATARRNAAHRCRGGAGSSEPAARVPHFRTPRRGGVVTPLAARIT